MAMGFYATYLKLGVLNTTAGLIVADSTIAVPFGGAGLHRLHVRHTRRPPAGGHRRRGRVGCAPSGRWCCRSAATPPSPWRCSRSCGRGRTSSSPARSTRAAATSPITLGIYHYIGNNNQQWNAIMATAVVASIPATVAARHRAALRRRRRSPPAPSRTETEHQWGSVFPIRDVPFSYAGSWFNISPVIGERRYAEDLHLVSHQTRHASGAAVHSRPRRPPGRRHGHRHAGRGHLAARRAAGSASPTRTRTRCGSAATDWACG